MRLARQSPPRLVIALVTAIVAGVLGLGASQAFATTYYINNQAGSGCSDAGAGTSTAAPWCNISNVTGKTFAAGDSILLARGSTWTSQTMLFTDSGTSGSPITLDAYGTGAKPIIQGTSQPTDRTVRFTNASYWNVSNLELAHAGAGLLFYYTTINHAGINISNIYAHHITGIVKGLNEPAGTASTDGIYFSTGILFTGSGLTVNTGDSVVDGVTLDNIEGTHNQESVADDWNNGSGILVGGTAKQDAMKNLVMNHLYLHDDDAHDGSYQGSSCSDSLRLVDTDHAYLINSRIDHEVACRSTSGTAAVFLARVYDLTVANDVLVRTPNVSPGSLDQTALDLDNSINGAKLYGNYWSDNAGNALEFLAVHSGDFLINNDIADNAFADNGLQSTFSDLGESIRVAGVQHVPTATISNNLYSETKPFIASDTGGNASGLTLTNNLPVSSRAIVYHGGNDWSGSQNTGGSACSIKSHCWSYQVYNGSTYSNLTYDGTNDLWGNSTGYVKRFEELPNSTSTNWMARAWTAPSTGTVSLRGRVFKSDVAGGDGVKARITKNGSVIWPVSGTPQTIAATDRSGYETSLDSVSVNAGDVIRFEVNNGGSGSNANDATSWAPIVGYTECTAFCAGETFADDWGFTTGTEGWTPNAQASQSVTSGINTVTSTGTDPQITSPDNLGINASTYKYVKVRIRNNTTNTTAQMFFTTTTDTTFNAAKSQAVTITASNRNYTDYTFDMSGVAGWTGTIKQLRFDPIAATGTVDVDYVRVSNTAPAAPAGTGLQLSVTNDGSNTANKYLYTKYSNTSYTFVSGDYLEYDVDLLNPMVQAGGLEIVATDGSALRNAGAVDQNGVAEQPGADLTYAFNRWYHRKIAIPASWVGKTVSHWDVVGEDDQASLTYGAKYDNIVITRGGVVQKTAYASSLDYLVSGVYLTSAIASSLVSTPTVP